MFNRDSRRSYRTYTYTTEFTLVRRYPKVSQRLRNVYRYCGTYSYTEVLVSTTELILVLRDLYGSYGTYTGISEHKLVFRIVYVYYRTYTCISNLIHVIQNLYNYLQNLYGSYGTYTYFTDTGVPVGTTELD